MSPLAHPFQFVYSFGLHMFNLAEDVDRRIIDLENDCDLLAVTSRFAPSCKYGRSKGE